MIRKLFNLKDEKQLDRMIKSITEYDKNTEIRFSIDVKTTCIFKDRSIQIIFTRFAVFDTSVILYSGKTQTGSIGKKSFMNALRMEKRLLKEGFIKYDGK